MNWLPVWLQLWLQKQFDGKTGKLADYVASFLFIRELQGWPVVRRIAPDVLVMKAPYIGPRRVQGFSGLGPPAWTGVAFGLLYYFGFGPAISGGTLTGERLLESAVFAGLFLGAASYPFWKLAQTTRFVIRFELKDGEAVMSWRGPDRQKQRVRLEEIHSPEVIAPHRAADEEARKHANWRQSNPREAAPKPLFQTSSELIIHTGPEGSHWRAVAEFVDDAHGEQANRLLRAIGVVIGWMQGEQATREKQAATAAAGHL